MQTIDLTQVGCAKPTRRLHAQSGDTNQTAWEIVNPRAAMLSLWLDAPIEVTVKGSTGYYCGGMNQQATVNIHGSAGPGRAKTSCPARSSSKATPANILGRQAMAGLIVVKGNASSRCGISMKGVNIVVQGNIGHMSAFMGQSGNLVVCGDAGDALGDSCYEARFFVRGSVKSLVQTARKKEMRAEHLELLAEDCWMRLASMRPVRRFTRYGSARTLYNFDVDNAGAY